MYQDPVESTAPTVKTTLVVVVQERCSRSRLHAFRGNNGRAIHQVNIEPTIVVVIEQRDARAWSLEDGGFFGVGLSLQGDEKCSHLS